MVKRRSNLFLLFPLLIVLVLLSACGGSSGSGDGAQGASTPTATTSTSGSDPTAVATAGTQEPDGNYAFVRKKQLWVHLKGDTAGQLTKFDYTKLPNSSWHRPLWSPDARYLSFIMNALPEGLGGAGCPAPDYGANGALYVYDTQDQVMTQLTPTTVVQHAPPAGQPPSGAWQYIFWEDATHLLAWSNGIDNNSKDAGLYRYDLTAQTIEKVISLSSLDASTLFDTQSDKNSPLLLSVRYSSGMLYYQVVKNPRAQDSTLSIYRRSVTKPDDSSEKVMDQGKEGWCSDNTDQQGPFVMPGWDVSADGNHLVTQLVSSQAVMGIQAKNLQNDSSVKLFQQASGDFLGHDLLLSWSPNSQTVVATEPYQITKQGPFTASLSSPTMLQKYTPYLIGLATWSSDSSTFYLQNSFTGTGTSLSNDPNAPQTIYAFSPGKATGQSLFADAHEIGWG